MASSDPQSEWLRPASAALFQPDIGPADLRKSLLPTCPIYGRLRSVRTDPKLDRAAERYLQTVFAIGCNLGPTQAARHMAGAVSAHMLSFVNRRHFTVEKL